MIKFLVPTENQNTMKINISDDEQNLLDTSDEELISSCQNFCFDFDLFNASIETGEKWHQLLRCHLHFEHVIDRMLKEALPFPEEISLNRMGFGQRLDLVRALDLLPAEIVNVIRFITKMRNDVAHKLNFEISDEVIKNFKNCMPPSLREAIIGGKKSKRPIQFYELLRAALIQTDILRQSHAAQRILTKKGKLRLEIAMQNAAKILNRST
jgi:hypothetical protein